MSFLQFAKANKLPVALLAAALGAFLWFAGHFVADAIYFNDPRHKDQTLEGWMTLRYVAMSYDLPREVIVEVLQLPPERDKRLRLHDLAAQMDLSLEELTTLVRAAAEKHRASAQ